MDLQYMVPQTNQLFILHFSKNNFSWGGVVVVLSSQEWPNQETGVILFYFSTGIILPSMANKFGMAKQPQTEAIILERPLNKDLC